MHNRQLSPKKGFMSKFIIGVIAWAKNLIFDGSKFSRKNLISLPMWNGKVKIIYSWL
jgi:hypothetical protein